MFFSDSRYLPVKDYAVAGPEGRPVKIKRNRFWSDPGGSFRYLVKQGDRVDLLTNQFYRNPRKWYLIADANPGLMYPDDLLTPGRYLTIPPNQGS